MATISQAALFNDLAYYITGRDANGNPQFRGGTPASLQDLPPGWKVYKVDAVDGQTVVTFTDTYDKQAYIAVEGTSPPGNDIFQFFKDVFGPDWSIANNVAPANRNSDVLAYCNDMMNKLTSKLTDPPQPLFKAVVILWAARRWPT